LSLNVFRILKMLKSMPVSFLNRKKTVKEKLRLVKKDSKCS